MLLAMGALNRINALQVQNTELQRELAAMRNDIAAERAAHDNYRDAVEARREAEEKLVEFYREAYHARVQGEAPRWLH
jgi:regulator of replication initiation timing